MDNSFFYFALTSNKGDGIIRYKIKGVNIMSFVSYLNENYDLNCKQYNKVMLQMVNGDIYQFDPELRNEDNLNQLKKSMLKRHRPIYPAYFSKLMEISYQFNKTSSKHLIVTIDGTEYYYTLIKEKFVPTKFNRNFKDYRHIFTDIDPIIKIPTVMSYYGNNLITAHDMLIAIPQTRLLNRICQHKVVVNTPQAVVIDYYTTYVTDRKRVDRVSRRYTFTIHKKRNGDPYLHMVEEDIKPKRWMSEVKHPYDIIRGPHNPQLHDFLPKIDRFEGHNLDISRYAAFMKHGNSWQPIDLNWLEVYQNSYPVEILQEYLMYKNINGLN